MLENHQQNFEAIIGRFCKVFDLSLADAARKLGIETKTFYVQKSRGTIPYREIVASTPPEHLAYILTGQASNSPPTIEQALQVITDAGYSVRKGG